MVLVEEKSDYLQRIEKESDLFFLKEYLWEKSASSITNESKIVHKLVFALVHNDISPIEEIIDDYSKRKPNPQSSYINNDLVTFLLICVIQKFKLDSQWLTYFIEQRRSEEAEKKSITKTFQNLLSDNLESKDNFKEIVFVYKEITRSIETNKNELNETYEKLAKKAFPFYDSQFLNLISLKAIDLIVLWKGLDDYVEFKTLRLFSQIFDKRVNSISKILFWTCAILLFILTLYFLYKFFLGTQEEKDLLGQIFSVLGFIGIPLISLLSRKKVEEFFRKVMNRLFGRVPQSTT